MRKPLLVAVPVFAAGLIIGLVAGRHSISPAPPTGGRPNVIEVINPARETVYLEILPTQHVEPDNWFVHINVNDGPTRSYICRQSSPLGNRRAAR
jgi:hypothetical protein